MSDTEEKPVEVAEAEAPEEEPKVEDAEAEAPEEAEKPAEEEGEEKAAAEEGEEKAEDAEDAEEDGEEKPRKRRKKREPSPSPPPRAKAPSHAPPPPPPKSYDVPSDCFSTKPTSNRVWEVEEEQDYGDLPQEDEYDLSATDLAKDFTIGKELGRGFFATAKEVTEKSSGKKFAVKVIEKSMAPQFTSGGLKSELDILSKLDHPNILKGNKVVDTDTHLLVVLELAEGGELAQALAKAAGKAYSESDVHRIAKQFVSAVAHVHDKKIIHGDIAPENLLLSGANEDSDIKLAGFSGAVNVSGDTEDIQAIGNAEFQAPEIIMNQGFNQKADLWSVGCVLYYLVEGKSPFNDSNTMRMNMKIRQGKFEFGDNWSSVSDNLKDLISKLIKVNPDERLAIADVQAHPWFSAPGNTALPNARASMGEQ